MKKLVAVSVLALLAALGTGTPATAKSPKVVDPATVTPALNPDFAPWSCFEAGSGIICQAEFRPVYENEPIGLQCNGQEVFITGTGREFMTRWHTADGLATRTIVHLDYPDDRFSLSASGDGPSVSVRGHWDRHFVYPVPGDRDSRVLTEVGAIYLVSGSGDGLVLQDTGKVTFEPGQDFEVVATMHGVHDHYEDPTYIDTVICDALT